MLPRLAVYPRFFPKQRPCRLAFMADKVVMIAICSARNVPQDSSRDHRGAESVIIERQQSAAGTARYLPTQKRAKISEITLSVGSSVVICDSRDSASFRSIAATSSGNPARMPATALSRLSIASCAL